MSDDLEARVDELERQNEILRDIIFDLEDVVYGEGEEYDAPKALIDVRELGGILERLDAIENGSDGGVRKDIDRDLMLPIHSMWMDLEAGREEQIPSDNARRGARLFGQIFRRAAGEAGPKVSVTPKAYVLDSGQARDELTAADDITDGGVSKTVARSMKAVQRFTKVSECDCDGIGACEHGLILFDDAEGTNKLRVDKDDLHEYAARLEGATSADDDGEQPSEAISAAEADNPAEAVDTEFDALLGASPVIGDSDTVVSTIKSQASESPLIPDDEPS